MITLRKSSDRGRSKIDWLDSYHTFSFGDYRDPKHVHFGPLRVINEDVVAPGAGFGMHPHAQMEIVTWMLAGSLEHRDSLGNGSVIRPGDIQRMSAGTGIQHSEFNPSKTDSAHLLQIWILPDDTGKDIPPEYEQKAFGDGALDGKLRLVASPTGRDGSVRIHRDTTIYAARLAPGQAVEHEVERFGRAWLQVAKGEVELFTHTLTAGDAAALLDEPRVRITAKQPSELLLLDLGA